MLWNFKGLILKNDMKYSKLLLVTLCFFFLFNGKKYEQAVIDRLSVPVKVCLEGQDCGSAAQASQSVAAVAPMAVKKVELSEGSEPVSYTHLTLPTICSV